MSKITIDPITRIEGHLGVQVEIEDGVVKDAWSSGNLFRGFEIMLRGKAPHDAWLLTQRICGVCPVPHGHASTLSLEDSFATTPPDNARIIRNLIEGAQFLHSHILWFYHLNGLDYVDVVSALSAEPTGKYLQGVQAKLKAFVGSGQLGPFANGYWGHPAYKLPPEVNLLVVAHYLEALEMQAKASHLVAIFGGRMPMNMTSVPGGTTATPTVADIKEFLFRLKEVKTWISDVMVQDLLAAGPYYLDWAGLGKGPGNYLSWGVFEDATGNPKRRLLPRGMVAADALAIKYPEEAKVTEHVHRSWYRDETSRLNPAQGQTEPVSPVLDYDGKYSWLKAPRLDGMPMEVGPLSRVLVAYLADRSRVKQEVDGVLSALGVPGQVGVLLSVVGRMAARVVESVVIAEAMEQWVNDLLENLAVGNTDLYSAHTVPDVGAGVGLWEAPRGALAHWNEIKRGKISNYQCVVPTTWNSSPRDDEGVRGPMEQALVGIPIEDPAQPLEVLRVIHSFDPCIACAVHVIDPVTNQVRTVQAVQ